MDAAVDDLPARGDEAGAAAARIRLSSADLARAYNRALEWARDLPHAAAAAA